MAQAQHQTHAPTRDSVPHSSGRPELDGLTERFRTPAIRQQPRPVAPGSRTRRLAQTADLTRSLNLIGEGQMAAQDLVLPLLYAELRRRAGRLMHGECPGHTLQPTALVSEAYTRLVSSRMPHWRSRAHFLAVSSEVMRRVLVDHARARARQKRGAQFTRISLEAGLNLCISHDPDVLALENVLRALARFNPRQARIIVMRFFGGMTVVEVATELGVSKRTIEAEWTMAKAWLRRGLKRQ